MTPAIVVIAYDRPDSLKRLLTSIEKAVYPSGAAPELIISIDKSDSDATAGVADQFEYSHGKKTVIKRPERMGLREHVLSCGDLTEDHGSIIVLEDDLFVAPSFYEFSCKALEFAEDDDRIGSVSLYNHLFNVHKREAFAAIDDGYDNWYLQIPSSWGQAYTKKQWQLFRAWYADNKDKDLAGVSVPANVSGWSDRSWLKYYIVYLIETGKYTLYPRVSYTTNFGDMGTHACKPDTDLQVPISGSKGPLYCRFSTLDRSSAVYDSFFENIRLADDCIVDLYGYKPIDEMISVSKNDEAARPVKYVLTCASLPYRVVKSFGRSMRPLDANVVYEVEGADLFLYDIGKNTNPPATGEEAYKYIYEYRGLSAEKMVKVLKLRVKEKLSKKNGRK